jgi:sugar-specific transcriptional regulator TrmB
MTLEKDLYQLGLKENEVKVFLAIIKLGEPTVGEIQKETGLHKQLIYNAAEELNKDNLINIFEVRRRKRFSAPNPSALEEKAKQQLQTAHQLVPRLLEISNQKRSVDDIRVYRGNRGVQHYYLSVIYSQPEETTVDILGVNSERYFKIFDKNEFAYKSFEETRISKKVKLNLLLFGNQKKELELNKNRSFVEIRLLEDLLQAPNDIMIWNDRVGMLFYGDEPYVLDLAGTETVNGFRAYFEAFWNKATKIQE